MSSVPKDQTGLVTVLHIMVERANVLYHQARGTRTRQAYLEGDRRDLITGAGASAVWFPSSFDLQGKFILDSGATMSTGGVDLLQKFQEIYADAVLQLTSHPVPPLRFSFANGQEDVSTSVLLVHYLPWKVIFYIRVLNAPGPVLLGADVHDDLGLVVDHVDCSVFLSHLKLEDTVDRLPSPSLCLDDVKAQCDSLTPQRRERLQGILSQREKLTSARTFLWRTHTAT